MLQSRHPHSAPHAFSSIGLRSGRPSTTPAPTPLVDLSALQAASRTLHDLSSKDAVAVPDLGDLITLRVYFLELRSEPSSQGSLV